VISSRAQSIAPFHAMRLLERARELEAAGRRVIHMEIGEPDFPTPQRIIEAGQRALGAGLTHYTAARGLPSLRHAIAGHYERRFDLKLDPDQILVTPGASGGLQLLLAALLDPGDGVLMTDPGYPCNRHMVQLLGGEPLLAPVGPQTNYQLTAEHLEELWRPNVRVVMVATPSNPTGAVMEAEALARLYEAVRARGASLLVDEIYQGLVYDCQDHTALALGTDGLFVVNSFSKFFGMTGWRVGWVVAGQDSAPVLDRLAQNLYLAAPTPSQHAALAAFDPETLSVLEQRRRELGRRRDFLLHSLQRLGFRFSVQPRGAFYLYADTGGVTDDSERLAADLLEKEAVAITPGLDFGRHEPGRHVRFAYTTELASLEEAVSRIRGFLGG
jgi:aspartate/methionine/tyrosine aminotransferase